MSLAVIFSRAVHGIASPLVTVEVHIANGLPAFAMVGLPEVAVRESKDRVRGALQNAHFEFPPRRVTVNLAPADIPKEGSRYDLPIAVGMLAASGQVPTHALSRLEFVGELALSGEVRPVKGVLPAAMRVRDAGRALVLPVENAQEAALVQGIELIPVRHLYDVCDLLNGQQQLLHTSAIPDVSSSPVLDLADVRGQHHAKRALEVAAAGLHNLLMIGPPGTGKSMLASRLPGLLPPMSEAEALETAAVYSVSEHGFDSARWKQRTFRAPHHTASGVALVGGGSNPRPGEISLAHNGVLFLDELPEFDRRVLEVLREPMESGKVSISRAARQAEFPARFQLIAAMNPCPCGFLGDGSGRCHCTLEQVQRYRARVSGPLLDRIDLQIEVCRPPNHVLWDGIDKQADTSEIVRTRVEKAYCRQIARNGCANAMLTSKDVEHYCALGRTERALLQRAMDKLNLSPRAYHRILKTARTIADLADSDEIALSHLSEAINYRRTDAANSASTKA